MAIENYVRYYLYLVVLVVAAQLFFQYEPATLVGFTQLSLPVIAAIAFLLAMDKAMSLGYKTMAGKTLKLLGLGIAFWLFGYIFWLIYQQALMMSALPFPSIADIGYVLFYIFTFAGMLYFLDNVRARFSSDEILKALPIPVILFAVVIFFVVAPVLYLSNAMGLKELLTMTYPTFDAILLFLSLFFIILLRKEAIGFDVRLLFAGYATFAIADVLFVYGIFTNTFYYGGPASILYVIGFGMVGIGAAMMETAGGAEAVVGVEEEKPRRRGRRRKRR